MPYIVSLRGSDVPFYDIYNKKVHFFNLILRPVNKYIWKKARQVVALSEGLKMTVLRTAPNQQIEVIPNGVETDIFRPMYSKEPSNSKLRLITVSRLINRKGIDHILEALAKLNGKKIKLLIVGTGNYENVLKKTCLILGLNDVVSFYGYCQRERLSKLYNKSDVFILPSLAESFGIVFAEAMACELAVIAGRTGGVPALVKNENGILVEPGNVKEIKNAIIRMKNFTEMRISMGKLNRKRVIDHYSWTRCTLEYLKIYRSEIEKN
jgi:glycosyltransferase involved in cell wall biosynthesis